MEYVEPIRDKKQVEAMKRYLKSSNNGLRDHCMFVLGINSGLRISDLLKLKVGDVADEKLKISERISIREKKTGKYKNFPINNVSKKALSEYLYSRKPLLDEPLFLSQKRNHLSRGQAWTILNQAATAVGIKENVGTHTLRKTFAYHAFQSGTDITLLQRILNHSLPSVTLAYIGITQDQIDDVYLQIEL